MHRLADSLLVAMEDSSSGDYLMVYLSNGQPSVLFNPANMGLSPAVMLSTTSSYNDASIHQILVVFDNRNIKLIVDGAERFSSDGMHTHYDLPFCYHSLLQLHLSSFPNRHSSGLEPYLTALLFLQSFPCPPPPHSEAVCLTWHILGQAL